MKCIALMGIVLAGAMLTPTAGFAQVACSREGLQRGVERRISRVDPAVAMRAE